MFENRRPKISESMNFMELSLHIMVQDTTENC